MRKLLALSLLAAACGGSQTFKDQSRDALPSKNTVAMGTPSASSATSNAPPDQIAQNSTAGQHSPFFDLTVGVAVAFNGGTAAMLGIVEAVTANEPTSCTANSCTWGPGSSALDYNNFKLVVAQQGDGYDWELSGQDKQKPTSDFVTFLSGHAVPGAQKHHGSGNFTIDFDKAATLPGPHDATGKLVVTSYSNVGPAHLEVTYTGAKDNQHLGQSENIVYGWPVDGKVVGIAIFDSPKNPRHPTRWHARDYGLFAANPFCEREMDKTQPEGAGDFKLEAGKSVTFNYRIILHEGDAAQAKIAERFAEYAKDAK